MCKHMDAPIRCATCEDLHDPYEPREPHGTERVPYEPRDRNKVWRILAGTEPKGPAVLYRPHHEGPVRSFEPAPQGPSGPWRSSPTRTRTGTVRRDRHKSVTPLVSTLKQDTERAQERINAGLAEALRQLNAM